MEEVAAGSETGQFDLLRLGVDGEAAGRADITVALSDGSARRRAAAITRSQAGLTGRAGTGRL